MLELAQDISNVYKPCGPAIWNGYPSTLPDLFLPCVVLFASALPIDIPFWLPTAHAQPLASHSRPYFSHEARLS